MKFITSILSLVLFATSAMAQFGFFEDMFGGHGGHHQQQPQNAGSDSAWYKQNYENIHCDKYLCPGTLSCVHFPHHCPCAFPESEDKFEFGDGSMLCVSKGGYKQGEAARKIELARKGLL